MRSAAAKTARNRQSPLSSTSTRASPKKETKPNGPLRSRGTTIATF